MSGFVSVCCVMTSLKGAATLSAALAEMHVAIATPAFPVPRSGRNPGIERLAKEMCEGLVSRGVQVTILTTFWNGGPPVDRTGTTPIFRVADTTGAIGRAGAFVDSHYWSWGIGAGAVLRDVIRPDIVHCLTPVASTPSLTRRKLPVVTTFHHPDAIWRLQDLFHRPFHRILEFRAYRASTLLITPSRASAQTAERLFALPSHKIRVVHWGVDPSRFRRGSPPVRPYTSLLYVGNHERRKGIGYLLDAMALVRREGLSVRLTTVGGGDQLPSLRKKAADLGISGFTTFLGYVPDPEDQRLPQLYSEADAFVFPSLMEGFGFVLVEAMASGVPVIASDVSAIPEVIGDAGVLVPPGNAVALARAIQQLVSDPERRSALGRLGRDRVTRLFTWDKAIPKLISTYSEAIDIVGRS